MSYISKRVLRRILEFRMFFFFIAYSEVLLVCFSISFIVLKCWPKLIVLIQNLK